MEKLKCTIERITYHNEQNGFSVVKVTAEGYHDTVAAVGIMPEIHVGGNFNLYGSWKVDLKYGRQFFFQTCEEVLPTSIDGIKKYLGSGFIKGIGQAYAEKIVNVFGEHTIDILNNEPDRLSEVPGLGAKRIDTIKKVWAEHNNVNNIMLFLQSHDISISIGRKILKQYGDKSVAIVTENPYRLVDEIFGIGFKTADAIASKLGFGHERFERIRSGILYTLNTLSDAGHCFAFKSELINASSELLEVSPDLVSDTLEQMISHKNVIYEKALYMDNDSDEAIYLSTFYHSEVGVAKRLLDLMRSSRKQYASILFNTWVTTDGKAINYDETQIEAINAALQNKVLVITGGPGTGKTTTTLGIIKAYREAGAKILLAAPTGRAAKRMSEVTKMEAKTIHRLLEVKPPNIFQRNENKPLNGDVLIVDECSMIDVTLMNSLLKAMPKKMTLILVGDVDQLPSVGAGKVLSDILASGVVPFIKLDRIFRQAQKSRIVTNAHKINHGEMPYLNDQNSDFIFIATEDSEIAAERSEKAADIIINLCTNVLPKQGFDPEDIQVLTPMRRGAAGSAILNQRLQEALNPEGVALNRGGVNYRARDKVMQIKNNYEKAVFNGDIGIISEINTEDNKLIVNFDERYVIYDVDELDELVLAYATTIHKSHGSEYPCVIMPITISHYVMLQRNLLYTGVTRAKKKLILVGEKKAVYICVKNNKIVERNTRLIERLRGEI